MNRIDFNYISEAYNTLQGKWQPFAVAVLITFLLLIVPAILLVLLSAPLMAIGGSIFGEAVVLMIMPLMLLAILLIMAAYFPALAGLMNMCLKTLDGETPTTEHLMEVIRKPVPFIIAGLIVGLLVSVGSMFCYVPGLIIGGLTMFTVPIMLKEKLAPVDAIKASFERLKPHWLMATIFYIVIYIIGSIGGYVCFIGLIFTLPLCMMSLAICYRNFHGVPSPDSQESPV